MVLGLTEERFDEFGKLLNAAQCPERELFYVVAVLDEFAADLTFGVSPHLLVGVQVRRIGRQVEKLETAFQRGDVVAHELRLVDGVAVNDHEDRLGCTDHQTCQEFLERFRRGGFLMDHEAKIAARADGGNHVEREAAACDADDRCLSDRRPGGAGVVIGTDTRLVGEVDHCSFGARLGFDRGIGLGPPLPDQLGILLPCLVQGLLCRVAKQFHDPADRRQGQGLAKLALDQLADQLQGPQVEFEFELLRRVVANSACDPTHLIRAKLGRPAGDRLGQQRSAHPRRTRPTRRRSCARLPHRPSPGPRASRLREPP